MGARKNHGSCLGLVLLSLGFQPSTRPHVGHSVGFAFPSRPPGRTALVSTAPQVCQPLTSGEVVSSPWRNPALSSETTIDHRDATPQGIPAPASIPMGLAALFGADLPKAMPYWFCTNRVHGCVSCLPGVRHFLSFLFFPSEQTGLNSHPLTRSQIKVTFLIQKDSSVRLCDPGVGVGVHFLRFFSVSS